MMHLKQKGIRAHVRTAGYRMSPDAWTELDRAVLVLLDRATVWGLLSLARQLRRMRAQAERSRHGWPTTWTTQRTLREMAKEATPCAT